MTNLIAALGELSGLGQEMFRQGFIVFLRVGAVMALMPAFGEQMVPQRIRLCLALAFAAIVTPAVGPQLPGPDDDPAVLLLSETAIGLALGIGLRLFVHALQTAAAIAAQATSLAQAFAGLGPEPQPAIGHLLTMAGLALAVASGLHIRVAEYLIGSYDVLPAGRLPQPSDLADWGLAQVVRAFSLGFQLAMPFVIASFLYNLALGVINRAMPQLMVSLIGAPALTAGGLILLAVATPVALAIWLAAFNGFLATPFALP